jgi:hypothetical protein
MKRFSLFRRTIAILVLLFTAFLVGRATADQPHMQAALDSLRAAERHLDDATSDKGGHRVKALRYVRRAIDEVELGIRFDRRH